MGFLRVLLAEVAQQIVQTRLCVLGADDLSAGVNEAVQSLAVENLASSLNSSDAAQLSSSLVTSAYEGLDDGRVMSVSTASTGTVASSIRVATVSPCRGAMTSASNSGFARSVSIMFICSS